MTVVICGIAGIGKTTIAADLSAEALSTGLTTWAAAADDVDSATPYRLWKQILGHLLGLPRDAGPADFSEALAALVSRQGGLGEVLAALEPIVQAGPGVDGDGTPPHEPAARAALVHRAMQRLLQARLADGPVLLVLEDMHWADSASWALLRSLRSALPALNWLLTTRADSDIGEDDDCAAAAGSMLRIDLTAFDEGMTAELLAAVLQVKDIDPGLTAMVQSVSGGHPLFAGVLARSLHEQGLLYRQGGQMRLAKSWHSGERAALMPLTLRAAVLQLADRLPLPERRLLSALSVLGHQPVEALPGPLAQWAGADGQLPLAKTLPIACALTLVTAERTTIRFGHALIRDVVYDTLSFAEREALHLAAAAWFAEKSSDDPTSVMAQAFHWLRTSKHRPAIDAAMRAGALAARQGADLEARRWFEQARERIGNAGLNDDLALRARCDRLLGHAACNVGEMALARRHLAASFDASQRGYPSRPLALAAGAARQAVRLLWALRPTRPRPRAVPYEHTLDSDAYATIRLSEAAYFEWDALAMLYAGLRGLADAYGGEDRAAQALWISGISGIAETFGLRAVAHRGLRHGLRLATELGEANVLARVWLFSSLVAAGAGRYGAALDYAGHSIEASRRCSDPRRLDDALICQVVVEHQMARYESTLPLIDECRKRGTERGDDQTLGWSSLAYGAAYLGMGDLRAATQALALARARVADRISHVNLNAHEALLAWQRGNLEGARELALRSIGLTAGTPTSFSVYCGLGEAARVLLEAVRAGGAPLSALDLALAAQRRYARVYAIGRALEAIYRAHREALFDRHESAARAMQRAAVVSEHLGLDIEARHAQKWVAAWRGTSIGGGSWCEGEPIWLP